MRDTPVLGALDIGTNSVHLVVARVTAEGRFETLTREREIVRLGRGGGDMKTIAPDAMERGIDSLVRMRRIADSFGAEVRAVATSAVREAKNSDLFVERARAEAGIDVEVISGVEEARLIYLGVLQALPVFDRRTFLIDIGGGSTEVLIGERGEPLATRSFKLGAVRLTDRFFPEGVVTPKAVRACREYCWQLLGHFGREIDALGFDVAVASSGTAEALVRIAHIASGAEPLTTYNMATIGATGLAESLAELARHRKPERRAKVPGLDAGRADIIVAGATILDVAAELYGIGKIVFSEAALREGVLADEVTRSTDAVGLHDLRDVSRRSIRQLAERCDEDLAHSEQTARLAVALFDGLRARLGLDDTTREYLEASALLANVGLVVNHSRHHLHAYYVIRNSDLAGLTDREIEIIAQVARYHRKSEPKASHGAFAALPPEHQELVRTLAAILRVAIGLDRSHRGRVADVRVRTRGDTVVIDPIAGPGEDLSLERYAATERKGLLEKVLGCPVRIA